MDYKSWLQYMSNRTGRDVSQDGHDYDLEGYYNSLKFNPGQGGAYDPKTKEAHLEDTYKLPNHPTFSDQSKYHVPVVQQGGTWAKNNSVMGYPLRQELHEGEHKFFQENPHVGGMAAEDNTIILNPYSSLQPHEKDAVAMNEALRLHMRNGNVVPNIKVTPEQNSFFKGTAYENSEPEKKQTIAARILTGDPSVSPTPDQKTEAEKIRQLALDRMKSEPGMKPDWSFKPSTLNLKNTKPDHLQGYFNDVESPQALDMSNDKLQSKESSARMDALRKLSNGR